MKKLKIRDLRSDTEYRAADDKLNSILEDLNKVDQRMTELVPTVKRYPFWRSSSRPEGSLMT